MLDRRHIITTCLAILITSCASESMAVPATPTPFQEPLQASAEAWKERHTPTAQSPPPTPRSSATSMSTSRENSTREIESPPENPGAGDIWISPIDGMPLTFIPEGKFLMGTDKNFAFPEEDEMPQRRVELQSFWIDQFEVSNKLYAICVEELECDPPQYLGSKDLDEYYGVAEYADYPVIYVSWEQASDYCDWAQRRLPSEAEWEKASRGATGQIYPWGWIGSSVGSMGVRVNYCDKNCSYEYRDNDVDDGYIETAPSDSFRAGASPYGVLNMAGNVWEWVADWYRADYYLTATDEDPRGPDDGSLKVIRGGSWMDQAWLGTVFGLRSANRAAHEPQTGEFYLGFRCALSAPDSEP